MTRATRPSTSPARANRSSAAPEPKTLCPLLVPSASAGGSPAASSAGSVMRPPPPAMASTVPATKEATTRSASAGRETSKRGAIYQIRNRRAMFIGHFGLAFAAKRLAPRTGLGTLSAASQWVDLVWPVLLLLGIEQVRIAPGDTAYTSLAFVHYPWTHSLLMSIAWGLLLGLGLPAR